MLCADVVTIFTFLRFGYHLPDVLFSTHTRNLCLFPRVATRVLQAYVTDGIVVLSVLQCSRNKLR
jgi:hypothetical protein